MSRTRWFAFAALAGLVVGCEGGVIRPPASQLNEGMNILEARPDFGVSAAFVKSGRVVYIETRIGPLKPEAFRLDSPNDSEHEMDVRYLDEHGNVFSVQRGGDEFIDPTWSAALARRAPVTKEARLFDFTMAAQAAGAIEAAGLPASMRDHVISAAAQGRIVPSAFPELEARAQNLATQQKDATYTEWHWQEADVYNKSVVIIGLHHAVLGWNYNYQLGSWDSNVNTCNHGPCASSMGFVCYTNSGWRNSRLESYFTGEGSTSTDSVTGACKTGYNWWSGSGT